ncbi:MAG: hypothetical protein JXD21_05385 [Candidatus Omnitrophica bacterium]|nr:hypothetical protein [Candidatus Omnitrophota bacterium]
MNRVWVCITILLLPVHVWAAFNLSVSPYEGGASLRFGTVGVPGSREVRIRISSTESTQYQVFQRILEPLTNERGEQMNMDAITSYAVRGSNGQGTLYQQQPTTLGYADSLLYTSSPAGPGDSFIVAYNVDTSRLGASGNFRGKIYYTLRPLGSGTQQEVFLNVYLDASGKFHVECTGSSGRNSVRMSTRNTGDQEGYVRVSFNENIGRAIRVSQEVINVPRNEMSMEISSGAIKFFTSSDKGGELFYRTLSPLERKRVLLYSSSQAQGELYAHFVVDEEKIAEEKAGIYRGRLKYIIEASSDVQEELIDFEIEVTPIFQLSVDFPQGGLNFTELLPKSPPQVREAVVEVRSNLGKPYIVSQKMDMPLMNEKGNEIAPKNFMCKAELFPQQPGRVKNPGFVPVPLGENPVFFSDERGSPARFRVLYQLNPYQGLISGNYFTGMSFSLQER